MFCHSLPHRICDGAGPSQDTTCITALGGSRSGTEEFAKRHQCSPVHSVHLQPTPHALIFMAVLFNKPCAPRTRMVLLFFSPSFCSPVVTVGNYMSLGRSVDSRWWWVYDLAIEGESGALSSLGLQKKCQLRTILSLKCPRMFCPDVFCTLDEFGCQCWFMLPGWLAGLRK